MSKFTSAAAGMGVIAVDHVGIAVPDLAAAIDWYRSVLGATVEHREHNDEQRVDEAMLVFDDSDTAARLQLIAPSDDTSTIAQFIDKRGPGLQQLAVHVADVRTAMAHLHAHHVRVLYDEPRRGTAGSRINFVHPKDAGGVLIELVQRP